MKINLVLIMVMLQLSETIDINRHTDIVLIGAQGDLPHPKNLNVELLEEYFR